MAILTNGELDILTEQNADAAAYEIDCEPMTEEQEAAIEADVIRERDAYRRYQMSLAVVGDYADEDDLPY